MKWKQTNNSKNKQANKKKNKKKCKIVEKWLVGQKK